MQGKDKNGKNKASDFLRYHGKEITSKERNALKKIFEETLLPVRRRKALNRFIPPVPKMIF